MVGESLPRVSSFDNSLASSPEMYHRPQPTIRAQQTLSPAVVPHIQHTGPRSTPLLPSATKVPSSLSTASSDPAHVPTIFGLPLKYVSLVTLAVQNATLSIVMHYSRVSIPSSRAYSPASAVLLSEVLKGSISFIIALARKPEVSQVLWQKRSVWGVLSILPSPFYHLCKDILSPDCWKLSIPALLYVVQNSLQFVAISNLPVASFQVTYQMKILTTAAFSVMLLRKKMTSTQWLSLLFLAIGVGIVQIQTSGSVHHDSGSLDFHVMNPLKGFGAVAAACVTSGLAGVYFEMVLKGSLADLWVRNVQLSLFSLVPALLPVLYASGPAGESVGFLEGMFRNFGGWAWATVLIQVFGGLVTAIVIKYSDNIMKGFATSLSIILSFLASVVLFNFQITPSFIIGSTTVLGATWMYNQPAATKVPSIVEEKSSTFSAVLLNGGDPILGQFPKKKPSPFSSPLALASALGYNGGVTDGHNVNEDLLGPSFGDMRDTARYNSSPYGSPYPSRPPSRVPSRSTTPAIRTSPRSSGESI